MKWMIENGTIVDGTKRPSYKGDIIVNNDEIIEIGKNLKDKKHSMDYVINAEKLIVSPGFIDTHSHSDLMILSDKNIMPKLFQGITTEVLGQDGISMAPTPLKTGEKI